MVIKMESHKTITISSAKMGLSKVKKTIDHMVLRASCTPKNISPNFLSFDFDLLVKTR